MPKRHLSTYNIYIALNNPIYVEFLLTELACAQTLTHTHNDVIKCDFFGSNFHEK